MKKIILIITVISLSVTFLFQLSEYSILTGNIGIEFSLILIAGFGVLIGWHFAKKNRSVPKDSSYKVDKEKIRALQITEREYEVLQKISEGLSNREIADRLYISESTIKTHVSNLLQKLNAKRRTQALQIAREQQII